MDSLDALNWMNGMLDAAMAAALASGVPSAELWFETETDRIEKRIMRGSGGHPQVGEVSTGTVVARVWMDGLELRYEGIELGAGWTAPGGQT
jgi:hypothetical protein